MAPELQLLIIEDNHFDATLLKNCIGQTPDSFCVLSFTDSIAGSAKRLHDNNIDVIILDLDLPDSQGLDTISNVTRLNPRVPIVVMTDRSDPEIGINAIKQGAQDFINKNELSLSTLRKSIFYAIERKRLLVEMEIMKQHEHELAMLDVLTGLPNRLSLMNNLETVIQHAKRTGEEFSVLFIDLDHFKPVNDIQGHQIGDQVLKSVARRLTEVLRESDIVARIGGDEFICLIHDIKNLAGVSNAAHKINMNIQEPFEVNNKKYNIGCSIGIAIYPKDGETSDELINAADKAMYMAKKNGRNQHEFAHPDMNKRARQDSFLENELRSALTNIELCLYYQPIVNIKKNTIDECEALIRWNHPEKGLLPPGAFIPYAEQSHLIIEIGEYVIRQAALYSKKLKQNNIDICIHINISASHFMKPNFISRMETILHEANIDNANLNIEITESLLMYSTSYVHQHFKRLNQLGIKISVDDFGTGYTSMKYLFEYPISTLKIDRSFIRNIHKTVKDLSIVKSFISLSEHLGLEIIIEGVENHEQLNVLKDLGCENIQGFYFSKPLPINEFESFLKEYNQ